MQTFGTTVKKFCSNHQDVLQNAVCEVAILFPVPVDNESGVHVPAELTVTAEARVHRYGVEHQLMLLQLASLTNERHAADTVSDTESRLRPYCQTQEILSQIDRWKVLKSDESGLALAWPVHDPAVTSAIAAAEAEDVVMSEEVSGRSMLWRVGHRTLRILRIKRLDLEGNVLDALEDQYGTGVECVFAWSSFYVQKLWALSVYAVLCFALDSRSMSHQNRWAWQCLKAGSIVWAAWVAWDSRRLFQVQALQDATVISTLSDSSRASYASSGTKPESPKPATLVLKSGRETIRIRKRGNKELKSERATRIVELLLVAFPALVILFLFCLCTLSGVTMLLLHIVWIWGDCLRLHSPETPCRDAEKRHAILGWAADVGCDIILAIMFELFYPIGKAIAEWFARLRRYDLESDERLFQQMFELLLNSAEKVGYVGSLAFAFAPQWQEPVTDGDHIAFDVGCGDLLFGDSDFRCYGRRLPAKTRRWMFESLMKGPFVVAPFISILVKVIIPRVAYYISRCCSMTRTSPCGCAFGPCRGLFRLLALIFHYDGDTVSCFKYVLRGPTVFSALPDDTPHKQKLDAALTEVLKKPFEVEDELMELEMSFLFVTFFMPVLPIGVLCTLVAKCLEINTDLAKMLYVRRKPVPTADRDVRKEMNTFSCCVVVAAVGWSAGLSLVTYNDDLYKYDGLGWLLIVGVMLWMLVSSILMTWVCTTGL